MALLADDQPPVVVAHYMTWYQTPAVSGSWGFWQVNRPDISSAYWHLPDQRNAQGWRDVASVFHPVVGPYDSADPDLCEYHILLARLAGIDGFVCDWYGFAPTPEHPYDHTGFTALLRTAEILDFRVALCWEDRSLFQHPPAGARAEAVARGQAVVDRLDREVFNSSAYLRIAGRPLLMNFAWGEPADEPGNCWFFPREWDAVLAPARTRPVFVHDYQAHHRTHFFEDYESVAPWGSCLHGRQDVPEFWARARAALGRGRFAFLSGTVRPGFDNRGCGGWGNDIAVDPRGDGSAYRAIWENVLRQPVRFVQIATWNDFNEGGTIEPTREGVAHARLGVEGYGYRELETTQEFTARLKGRAPDPDALRLPALLYACRKLLARVPADAQDGPRALDAARADLLAGHTARARATLEAFRAKFPEELRRDPDLRGIGE
jgi:glycoprotein endo-alpha-1,2-mannosidase